MTFKKRFFCETVFASCVGKHKGTNCKGKYYRLFSGEEVKSTLKKAVSHAIQQ